MKDKTAFVVACGLWAWAPLMPVIRPWACLVGSAIGLFQTMWREKADVLMRCPHVPLFN